MRIKCVVSCRDANGSPSFFPCTVSVTKEQYDDGDHYDLAAVKANDKGYENVGIVYDENDGPSFLFAQYWREETRMRLYAAKVCEDRGNKFTVTTEENDLELAVVIRNYNGETVGIMPVDDVYKLQPIAKMIVDGIKKQGYKAKLV